MVSTSRLAHDRIAAARINGDDRGRPFHKLFGILLGFVYHCLARIVIQGDLVLCENSAGSEVTTDRI
jgi:hypothetical protein